MGLMPMAACVAEGQHAKHAVCQCLVRSYIVHNKLVHVYVVFAGWAGATLSTIN
ncbi:hypothetical protein DPMN_088691 [Dreissena polymorpha]|uniref:Uncharacterized protein n=1 Tax=Dreissena polymorpha TaxID=45954 RepID=A0A9D4QY43_DREPO|nr:hypothetical protein DPMN_088691 [Dreissena polymorpha]